MTALKPYPKYKPSGIEWLGDIPAGWVRNKIKNITDFQVGWTPSTSEDKYFIGNNSWANISDLKGKTIFETEKCLSDEAVKSNRIKINPKGSLLFSFKLSVGSVSFAGIDLYTNEAIASFLISSKINLNYLYYAAPLFILQNASNNIYGAKILNQELIRNAVIVPPPIEEQAQIAEFLDEECGKIDALIEKSEKMIELLDERRQAVITHYVTKGTNPNAPLKPSGIEWINSIPEGWIASKLKRYIHFLTDYTANGSFADLAANVKYYDDNKYSRIVRLTDLRVNFENEGVYTNEKGHNYLKKSSIKGGEILIANVGAYAGLVCIVPNISFTATLGPNMYLVIFKENIVHKKFIFFLLNSKFLQGQISARATSTAQPKLNKDDIKELIVCMPPISEQTKIVEIIESETARIDSLKGKIIKQIDLLKERKTSLITAAVTGKIDVRNYKEQREAA